MRLILIFLCLIPTSAHGAEPGKTEPPKQIYEDRLALIESMSALTGIPWYYLAAIDQYERTLTRANRKTRQTRDGLIAIDYPEERWAGPLNPDKSETDPLAIALMNGAGTDGDGDGKADRMSDIDALSAMARHVKRYGTSPDDIRTAVWEHYYNPRAVQRVEQFARIYEHYGTLDLDRHVFPVPLRSNHTYRSTWGARRGWGGVRIHEGTDIFADYGVPVRSTCYGIIEVKGWNRYGGWRVGIRSIHNVYHYYAHLSGFSKLVQPGQVVEPGDVIGWVGSSGYGKPGTSGKFPPHLHYGLYRDNGWTDWAFDPYPNLTRWSKEEARRSR